MTWPILNIPVQQSLARRYIERDDAIIESLYEYHPDRDWEARVRWVDEAAHLRADRKRLVSVLRRYNKARNDHPAVTASLDRLERDDALVVVGGQQGGLFTGPLLVVYKAVSIIRMAQEAEARLGRPVIPIFWIAGEDHDFDEVNHAYFLTPEPSVARVRVEKKEGTREPVSSIRLDEEQWEAVLNEVDALLPATEFKPALMEQVREASAGAASLTDACAVLLGGMFGPYGLVFLDSADPELRQIEGPMFRSLIAQNDLLRQAYGASERELASCGFPTQADRAENGANLFLIHEGERHLLFKEDEGFTDRHRTLVRSADELMAAAESAPHLLSNNVLTRPLMQEYLFPVLAIVLGPGEIAYWAQTKEAFRALGMRMPLLWPRMGFTCLEGTVNKLLGKYELTAEDIIGHYEERKEAWLTAQDELGLDERFASLRHDVDARYEELLARLNEALPALGRLGDTNRAKVLEQIDFLHHRAKDALQKQHESGLRQWERMRLTLHPQDRPQERVYNMLMYACRYGDGWFKPIMEAPVLWNGENRLVVL